MKQTDLAWAAGFIDGEGTFYAHYYGTRYGYHAILSACNCEIVPIRRLQRLFGGNVRKKQNRTCPNQRAYYVWEVWGKLCRKTVPLLLPYLVVKRRRAVLLLKILTSMGQPYLYGRGGLPSKERQKRAKVLAQLTVLNRKGVHL